MNSYRIAFPLYPPPPPPPALYQIHSLNVTHLLSSSRSLEALELGILLRRQLQISKSLIIIMVDYSENARQAQQKKGRRMSVSSITEAISRRISRAFARSSMDACMPDLHLNTLPPDSPDAKLSKDALEPERSDTKAVFEDPSVSRHVRRRSVRSLTHAVSKRVSRVLPKSPVESSDTHPLESPKSDIGDPPASGGLKRRLSKIRSALVTFRQNHEESLIRRLPYEVMALIFMETVTYHDQDSFQTQSIPVVSQVCSLWREMALSTPDVWRKITVDLDPNRFVGIIRSKPINMHLFDLLLHRSQNSSRLDIVVSTVSPNDANHPAFQRILDCSDRWECARLRTVASLLPFFQRIKGHVASLRTLDLFVTGKSLGQPFNVFETAPRLRQVHLNGHRAVSFPWAQILDYNETTYNNRQRQESLFTSGRNLSIVWMRGDRILSESLDCFNLESLEVSFGPGAQWGLLAKLSTPNIKKIKIATVHDDITPHLIVMIRNSPPPCLLQKLTFCHDFLRPGLLTDLLQLTPYLEELDIHLPPEEDLRNLVANPLSPYPLAPKLKSLRIIIKDMPDVRADHISHLAASRCEPMSSDLSVCRSRVDQPALLSIQLVCSTDSIRHKYVRSFEKHIENRRFIPDHELVVPAKLDELATALKIGLARASAETELDNIFSDLTMYPVTDVNHLYSTNLHMVLHQFVTNPSPFSRKWERKYKFQSRASNLLSRWNTLILVDIPSRLWGRTVDGLVYVSTQDALRLKDPLSIVYGPQGSFYY